MRTLQSLHVSSTPPYLYVYCSLSLYSIINCIPNVVCVCCVFFHLSHLPTPPSALLQGRSSPAGQPCTTLSSQLRSPHPLTYLPQTPPPISPRPVLTSLKTLIPALGLTHCSNRLTFHRHTLPPPYPALDSSLGLFCLMTRELL